MRLFQWSVVLAAFLVPAAAFAAFRDVSAKHPYASAISYIQERGIVTGYADGTYRPDVPVNRAEFTKILMLYAASVRSMYFGDIKPCQTVFSDVKTSAWYFDYLCKAKAAGWVGGYADGSFGPGKNISFAEAAKIITVADTGLDPSSMGNDEPWYMPFVRYLSGKNAVPQSIGASYGHSLTRGEMAEILYRLQGDAASSKAFASPSASWSPEDAFWTVLRVLYDAETFEEYTDASLRYGDSISAAKVRETQQENLTQEQKKTLVTLAKILLPTPDSIRNLRTSITGDEATITGDIANATNGFTATMVRENGIWKWHTLTLGDVTSSAFASSKSFAASSVSKSVSRPSFTAPPADPDYTVALRQKPQSFSGPLAADLGPVAVQLVPSSISSQYGLLVRTVPLPYAPTVRVRMDYVQGSDGTDIYNHSLFQSENFQTVRLSKEEGNVEGQYTVRLTQALAPEGMQVAGSIDLYLPRQVHTFTFDASKLNVPQQWQDMTVALTQPAADNEIFVTFSKNAMKQFVQLLAFDAQGRLMDVSARGFSIDSTDQLTIIGGYFDEPPATVKVYVAGSVETKSYPFVLR